MVETNSLNSSKEINSVYFLSCLLIIKGCISLFHLNYADSPFNCHMKCSKWCSYEMQFKINSNKNIFNKSIYLSYCLKVRFNHSLITTQIEH